MKTAIYNNLVKTAVIVSNPMSLVQKLERGDADSSGSTIRTAGVVALVLVIFAVIAAAVAGLADTAASGISGGPAW